MTKKVFIMILSVAIVFSLTVTVSSVPPDGCVAYYTFDGNDVGLTEVGENFIYNDSTVRLGEDSYYKADLDLSGMDSLSVAFRVIPSVPWGGACRVFEISSEESLSHQNRREIGAVFGYQYIDVERFNSPEHEWSYYRDTLPTTAEVEITGWLDIVCVYTSEGANIVYHNGVEVGRFEVTEAEKSLLQLQKCVGEAPELLIGASKWPDDVTSKNLNLDVFAIYDHALTPEEVLTAFEEPVVPPSSENEPEAPKTGFAAATLSVGIILSAVYILKKKSVLK